MKTDNLANVGKHAFEVAGLGTAPFRFTGASENVITYPDGTQQAGGSCDYCGTGIRLECHVRSADGKNFKVGCNCIAKVGDTGLLKAYKQSPEFRAHQRELKRKRDAARNAAAQQELDAMLPHVQSALNHREHPAIAGKTLRDYYDFILSRCGASAALKMLKFQLGKEVQS